MTEKNKERIIKLFYFLLIIAWILSVGDIINLNLIANIIGGLYWMCLSFMTVLFIAYYIFNKVQKGGKWWLKILRDIGIIIFIGLYSS